MLGVSETPTNNYVCREVSSIRARLLSIIVVVNSLAKVTLCVADSVDRVIDSNASVTSAAIAWTQSAKCVFEVVTILCHSCNSKSEVSAITVG